MGIQALLGWLEYSIDRWHHWHPQICLWNILILWKVTQSHWKICGESPLTRVLTREIATAMQQATESDGVRQYGV
jgi:hypothetical protein